MSSPEALLVQLPSVAAFHELSDTHQEYLLARAVPLEMAQAAGLRSVTGARAAELLCRQRPVGCDGLAIPYPGVEPHYVRVRMDDATLANARYLAPAGREVPVYVPAVPPVRPSAATASTPAAGAAQGERASTSPTVPQALTNVLVVVESPVKALAMRAAGLEAVGLGGTGTTLSKASASSPRLNASWTGIALAGRDVIILFDAGRAWNPNVARDEARLARALAQAGAQVRVASLPPAQGGGDQGPDDFLAGNGAASLWAVLGTAQAADPVARAADAVKGGGVPGLLNDTPFLISVIEAGAGTQLQVRDILTTAGVKAGDWKSTLSRVSAALKGAATAKTTDGAHVGGMEFTVHQGCIASVKHSDTNGPSYTVLANFDAYFEEETVRDDGLSQQRSTTVVGRLCTGEALPRVHVTADELTDPAWAMKKWGVRIQVPGDFTSGGQLRLAIQRQSQPVQRHIKAHTGWALPRDESGEEGGTPIFLHAGGAVGADGIAVELDGAAGRYRLPDAVDDAAGAVRTSLALLEVGPRPVTVPMLLAVYLAPLQSVLYAAFSIWLVGQSGSMKTTLATLMSAHEGEGLADRPAASWADSIAALEAKLFQLKDELVVVDDYKPRSTQVKDEMRVKAYGVVSSVGNGEGRGRMRPDGTARPERPPRAFLVSTAEVMPDGESTLARTLQLHLKVGELDLARLSAAQRSAGRLAHAKRAYLEWLRTRLAAIKPRLLEDFVRYRDEFRRAGGHLRAPAALAHLALAADLLAEFAQYVGALNGREAARQRSEWMEELRSLAADQAESATEASPAERFLEVLRELLVQRKARLEPDLTAPLRQGRELDGTDLGTALGWESAGKAAYLLPEATYRAVADAMRAGEPLPLTATQLWRRLHDLKLIEDGDRPNRRTRRHVLGGQRQAVIEMPWRVLYPNDGPPEGGPQGPGTGGPGEAQTVKGSPCAAAPCDDGDFGLDVDGPAEPAAGWEPPTPPASRPMTGQERTSDEGNRTSPVVRLLSQPSDLRGEEEGAGRTAGPDGPLPLRNDAPSPEGIIAREPGQAADSSAPSASLPPESGPSGPAGPERLAAQVIPVGARAAPGGPLAGLPAGGGDARVSAAGAPPSLVALTLTGRPGAANLHFALPDGQGGVLDGSTVACLKDARVIAHDTKPVLAQLVERFGVQPEALGCTATLLRLLAGSGHAAPSCAEALGQRTASPASPAALFALWTQLEAEARREGLERAAVLETALLPVVVDLERAGVGVDAAAWRALTRKVQGEADALRQQVKAALRVDNPDDDARVLVALRAHGLPVARTATAALAPYAAAAPGVAAFLEYRRRMAFVRDQAKSVNAAAARAFDGRVRAVFDPLAAPTGRFGCSRPNLLGLPKEARVRRCIVPAPGHVFVVADYRAIDLRVLAHVTGDARLRGVFVRGEDPHRATAAVLLGKEPARVTDAERGRAKPVNFGIAFGMGIQGLAEYALADFGVSLTPDAAASFRATFLTAYAGVADWQARVREARAQVVRTGSGRLRRFREGDGAFCQRLSTEVQGTAADGMKQAMVLLHGRLRAYRARLVLPVHDELVVEAPAECAEPVRELVAATMVEGMSAFVTSVPIEVTSAVRTTWAEGT